MFRRELMQTFTFPHSHSNKWARLDEITKDECSGLIRYIKKSLGGQAKLLDLQPLILKVSKFREFQVKIYVV